MANFKGKRMVDEDLIKKLEDLDPSGGAEYTAGTGIEISAENEISVDTDTIATKSELFSGDYDDLTDKPDLSIYAESSDLATVATTGAYSDLLGTPTLATVATTGDYDDLTNKPTIPAAVSGTNDGTNWTGLTIGSDTYAIPAGGGSSYTFTNGLTESAGTVSWDLNNKIKSVDGSANGLGLRTAGDFGAAIGNYASSTTPSTSGYAYGIEANESLIVAKATGTSPKIKASSCSLVLCNSTYNSTNVSAGSGSIVGAYIFKSDAQVSSLNHSIVFGRVDSNSGSMTSTGNECLLVGRGLQSASNYQTVIGQDNIKDSNNQYAFIIGNGSDSSNRSNAMTVAWDGTIVSKNLPAAPTTAGTYTLQCTVDAQGNATYSWV